MNLTLPEKEKVSKKTISIYIISIFVCILSIIVVIGIQVLGDDIVNNIFGINKLVKRTEQEEAVLKANFEEMFDNTIENIDNKQNYNIQKIETSKEIIYKSYEKRQKNEKYELNVNLPYVNIKNAEAENFNKEIKSTFEAKSEEILKSTDRNIIYSVNYKANIENNILSLIIYSDLKQDMNAQRVIIQTFNFNLEKNEKIELSDALDSYNINENEVQNKIDKDIKEEQRKSDELKEIGYNVFSRDLESKIYKIQNIKEFFIYSNNIYVIFAYGNEKITSQKDIVII